MDTLDRRLSGTTWERPIKDRVTGHLIALATGNLPTPGM